MVGGGLTMVLLSYVGMRDQRVGRDRVGSVSFAILYGVVSVAFSVWCLAWVRRRWPSRR